MVLAAEDALSFVAGLDEQAFGASDLHQSAVIRKLEVIGEAAGKVSKSFCAAHPEIPWQDITGMRHRLIHDYSEIPQTWRHVYLQDIAYQITDGTHLTPKYTVAARVRSHLKRVLSDGGLLRPKTLGAFVDRIVDLDASIAGRLAGYSERRREALRRLRLRESENLALQKETLGIALEISGISRDELLAWQLVDGSQRSFLDVLPGTQVHEDAMLPRDFSTVPGFEAISEVTHYGSKVFEKTETPSVRLTVIMANRLPLEQQTGRGLDLFQRSLALLCDGSVQSDGERQRSGRISLASWRSIRSRNRANGNALGPTQGDTIRRRSRWFSVFRKPVLSEILSARRLQSGR
jgi:uncharacterized protein with HEPN domain